MMKKSHIFQRSVTSSPIEYSLKKKQNKHSSHYVFILQHILYRQKEQFSDGVGYSWIDGLKAHAEQHVIFFLLVYLKDQG